MAEKTPPPPPELPKKDSIDRRSFVKKTMVAAAAGAAVAGATPMVVPLSYNPRKIKRFPYVGARIFPPGPAPQGIPLIPVKINAKGELEGVPENKESSVPHSLEWYKYCSHEGAPGLELSFTDDNIFRYYTNPEKVAIAQGKGIALWYQDFLDQPMLASHFKKVGDGAPFRWRSEGQVGNNIVTGIVIKIDPKSVRGTIPKGFIWENEDGTGFIAFCSFCAHFCCVPGYTESGSDLAREPRGPNGRDIIFCSCHDSRYDPLDLRRYQFPPDF